MAMSHPWFTLIGGAFCVLFIYVLGKVFIDNEKRLSELRSALDGLLRIARQMRESGERYDAGQNF